ncbi:MAG: proline dipeptidase [Candidatus Peribacteria bacterium]|nr:proline dipeptidase [Candidatus Peribacteria bacterium]
MHPKNAKELLRAASVPALLVTHPVHLRYLLASPVEHAYLFITPGGYDLFTNLVFLNDRTALEKRGVHVHATADFAGFVKDIPVCGFESAYMPVQEHAALKKKYKRMKFVPVVNVVEEFRRTKTATEIRYMKRARRMTAEILRRVPSQLRTSVTEKKLANQLHVWALELGADGLSFDPIVAFGTHTGFPHHIPSARKLQRGHIVQIDVGATYKGYCSDASDVFFTAPPFARERLVYATLRRAKNAAILAAKAGVTNHELDELARRVLREQHLEDAFCHALGHGVGLDIHEGVIISSKAPEKKLLRNEVIAIEPGVYFPGKFGMRVEETIIVV